jgi:hypothetical protein
MDQLFRRAGAAAGMIEAVVVHPLDMIKTRYLSGGSALACETSYSFFFDNLRLQTHSMQQAPTQPAAERIDRLNSSEVGTRRWNSSLVPRSFARTRRYDADAQCHGNGGEWMSDVRRGQLSLIQLMCMSPSTQASIRAGISFHASRVFTSDGRWRFLAQRLECQKPWSPPLFRCAMRNSTSHLCVLPKRVWGAAARSHICAGSKFVGHIQHRL